MKKIYKKIILLVVIIVVLIIAGAGCYVYTIEVNKGKESNINNIDKDIQNVISNETKFAIDEISVNGMKAPFTKDKITAIYGNPQSITEHFGNLVWNYEGIKFYFSDQYSDYSEDTAISIEAENKDITVSRNIKIGDSFESVLAKFPKEYDYTTNEDGFFYGSYDGAYDGTAEGGGLVHENKTTIAVWDNKGYMHINFEDNKVISVDMRMAHTGI